MPDAVSLLPLSGKINLRGRPDDSAFLHAVAGVLGAAPPVEPNMAVPGPASILWLQPTSWLVVAPLDGIEDLASRLRAAVGAAGTAVDVSDTRLTYEITGPDAVRLLARGCSLDLHPRVFPAGRSAQCAFAQLHALLVKVDESPTFHLFIPRGAQRHVENWFAATHQ
ncbi:MAG TPA: sarcosine oxidase subunit gamma family protein [Azospirillum sp.]|nr:sarcosine oxidase subunit gamma family protein [Azospirillum sp.]